MRTSEKKLGSDLLVIGVLYINRSKTAPKANVVSCTIRHMAFLRGTQELQVLTPDLEAVSKPFLIMLLGILSKPVILMSHDICMISMSPRGILHPMINSI